MNGKTIMLPPGAERWYDGTARLPPKRIIKRASIHTSLWLIIIVTLAPGVQVDHA